MGRNFPENIRISGRIRYVTGPLTTPIASATDDVDNSIFIPTRGSLYSERLSAFSMVDLRIDKKWIYNTWTLSLYVDIQNILNHQNTEGVQYAYDYQTQDTVKGIPFLPTFGLKGEF